MKQVLFAVCCLLFAVCCYSQNIVPNGSFEYYSECPTDFDQLDKATPWYDPTHVSSDYFNECDTANIVSVPKNLMGYENAHYGKAYSGFISYDHIVSNVREYIQVHLEKSMTKNKKYCVSFFLSLSDSSRYAIRNVGAFFSEDSIHNISPPDYVLSYSPQIFNSNDILDNKNNWMEISGSFTASGGESYLTIGNFNDDTNTDTLFVNGSDSISWGSSYYEYDFAYYYIDDVSVIEEIDANAGSDTLLCEGDSVQLGELLSDTSAKYSWFPGNSLSDTSTARPFASPTVTTKYYLTITSNSSCKGNLTDSVTVTVKNCKTDLFIPTAFSPNGDGVNDILYVRGLGIKDLEFRIYDRWGEEVFESESLNEGWDGNDNNAGVYVYTLSGIYSNGETFSKKGYVTLIK